MFESKNGYTIYKFWFISGCMAYFKHHFTLDIWWYLAQPWDNVW